MNLTTYHELGCDILVAGGGAAGVACAIAAARCGAKVILCQDRPVLGGNASSEVRMHIVGADCSGWRSGRPLEIEAREGGIIEEMRLENAVRNPQRSASMMDLILYEKCLAEPNLTLMLNTAVVGAAVEDHGITQARASRPSTEDEFTIRAPVYVDCTGDGRLGAEAGAPYRHGREPRDEFAEPLALPKADRNTLGSTLLFQARDMGRPMPFAPPPWARKFSEDDLRLRSHHQCEYGYWWVEWGGRLDTIKDNEKIRHELLAILLGVWDHIKNGPGHGAENWALTWFGFLPGKRESRRFLGLHVLTQADILEARDQPDAIAYGGWPIDIHPPEGVDGPSLPPCSQHHVPHLYPIPLRSCVSRRIRNLMFAGRNISATHVAFASTRVMATCAVIGQGVGTAAAYAASHRCDPVQLPQDKRAVKAIQQRLLCDDCFLIGEVNEDESDLAHRAAVRASSQQPDGPPQNILSGTTRAVHGDRGARPDRSIAGSHRWMSDPAEGLPAWLELSWDPPVRIGEIRLVFDTGLHRVLTLSHDDAYTEQMVWEAQPETIRDYRLEYRTGRGDWRVLQQVVGNYQRLRVHRFDPVTADAIRIVASATWGLHHARIADLRCYGPPRTA